MVSFDNFDDLSTAIFDCENAFRFALGKFCKIRKVGCCDAEALDGFVVADLDGGEVVVGHAKGIREVLISCKHYFNLFSLSFQSQN